MYWQSSENGRKEMKVELQSDIILQIKRSLLHKKNNEIKLV